MKYFKLKIATINSHETLYVDKKKKTKTKNSYWLSVIVLESPRLSFNNQVKTESL